MFTSATTLTTAATTTDSDNAGHLVHHLLHLRAHGIGRHGGINAATGSPTPPIRPTTIARRTPEIPPWRPTFFPAASENGDCKILHGTPQIGTGTALPKIITPFSYVL